MVLELTLASFVIIFYGLASGCQAARVYSQASYSPVFLHTSSWIAIILHSVLLYLWIDGGHGQNLSVWNFASQVIWLICVFVSLGRYFLPLDNVALIAFSAAIVSIFPPILFPRHHILLTLNQPAALLHIFLSFIALSISSMAVFQAIFVLIQHYALKKRSHVALLLRSLPSLEQMESLLFQMIFWGLIVLSILIVISLFAFIPRITDQWQHVILAVLAWIVYAVLLLGRYFQGWRGTKAVFITLMGFAVLSLCYLAARFVF